MEKYVIKRNGEYKPFESFKIKDKKIKKEKKDAVTGKLLISYSYEFAKQ